MSVDLNEVLITVPESVRGSTNTISVVIPAGKTIKIEYSPDGEEIASGVVPDGKKWTISIVITIDEDDE